VLNPSQTKKLRRHCFTSISSFYSSTNNRGFIFQEKLETGLFIDDVDDAG
jgi:hypothetical protein